MPPYFAWQALHGQGWPASEEQEIVLVEDLRRAADSRRPAKVEATRCSTTALLNALRCGVTYAELVHLLPAIDPRELIASHDLLSEGLATATDAWEAIVKDHSATNLAAHRDAASLVVPVPVHRIDVALANINDPDHAGSVIAKIAAEVTRVTAAARRVEERLATIKPGSHAGLLLGRSLHDVSEPGVWTHPHFLPTRVGQLSTTRARDLRGDKN